MLHSLRFLGGLFLASTLSCAAFAQTSVTIIRNHLTENAARLKVLPADVAGIELVSEASSKAPGVTHAYVRQTINGIPVVNGLATVTIKNGNVVYVANRLKPGIASGITQPAVSAENAVKSFAGIYGIAFSQPFSTVSSSQGKSYVFTQNEISSSTIPVTLVYYAHESGALELCWDLSIRTIDGQHWYSARVSATDGKVIEKNDWMVSCSFEHCGAEHAHTATKTQQAVLLPPPPPGADQYMVYALPVISPDHGPRSLVINPSDVTASPYGWHDTDGENGDEYTITRGNNVYASEDIDDDDEPGYSPDGLAALDFDFDYVESAGVQGNLDAVITNLFYMNNMMHDIWYHYGFDEASGNFQHMNYSGDGLGDDYVFADAQDGSGTNNANFGTPPEGMNPRMQMYLWSDGGGESDVLTINSPASIAQSYPSMGANFGAPIPTVPLTADVVLVVDGAGADPNDGCETITNAAELVGKIALVRRGNCTFGSKAEAVEAVGAVAVIVYNNTGGDPIAMGGTSNAEIPALMISLANANAFIAAMASETVNATIVVSPDLSATDSDFDNMIIAHEYGHGISTRLVGGAENSDCLFNAEQMGEGWSDWFGLMITQQAGDLPGAPRGVGTYVTNQPIDGTGIRPAPYSTDFNENNYTYNATNNSGSISEPHGIGFIWATMLWDLNWALVDEYGFDANLKTGTGGNNKAMALVIEGLKLTPCGPGFVDARDAILAADELLYDGANECLIWEVFAKRGLGYSASQGSSEDRQDQVQAFDLPPQCNPELGMDENGLDRVVIYPNPAKTELNIDLSGYKAVKAIRLFDLQGKLLFETETINSALITVDLSAYRSGVYMVQLTGANGERSVEIVKH